MSKKQKPVSAAVLSPAQVAHAALLPVFESLQGATVAAVDASASRSKLIVSAIKALFETSTDYAADRVAVFGDGLRSTKKSEGTKGTLADALNSEFGDKLQVTVRSTLAHARAVAENWSNPAVREAAEKSGLRKARDVAKPSAKPETAKPETAKPEYSLAVMCEMVAAHLDDAIFALRQHMLHCADSISIAKIGEIEVHLASKTKKTA